MSCKTRGQENNIVCQLDASTADRLDVFDKKQRS